MFRYLPRTFVQDRRARDPLKTPPRMTISTLVAALCWHAAGPTPALRSARQDAASMSVVDLFPDPPSVAGVIIRAPESRFPSSLEQPTEVAVRTLSSSLPDFSAVLLAPLEPTDAAAALFVRLPVVSESWWSHRSLARPLLGLT